MRKSTAELIVKDPARFAHHDRVFLNNPVVMQGMGLAPLVVLATSGQNAVMLAAAVALLPMASRPAGGFIVLGVLCAVWRALAKQRRNYLEKEARSLVAVDHQQEADSER